MVWFILDCFCEVHGSTLTNLKGCQVVQNGEECGLCWSHAASDNVHGVID